MRRSVCGHGRTSHKGFRLKEAVAVFAPAVFVAHVTGADPGAAT